MPNMKIPFPYFLPLCFIALYSDAQSLFTIAIVCSSLKLTQETNRLLIGQDQRQVFVEVAVSQRLKAASGVES